MWFLHRDDNIFKCSVQDDGDFSGDNAIVGIYAIINGGTFFFYIPFLLVFAAIWGLCINCGDDPCILCVNFLFGKLLAGVGVILGYASTFTGLIGSAIVEHCGSAQSNAFIVMNVVMLLFNAFAGLQVFAVIVVSMIALCARG